MALGSAGVVTGLVGAQGQPALRYRLVIQTGLGVDILAGILAMFTFLPRKWPV